MSYGLNIEMHKQVSYFFITILNDSNTGILWKEKIVCFCSFILQAVVANCI